MTVLTSLGGRHVNDLARAALDDDVPVLTEGRALKKNSKLISSLLFQIYITDHCRSNEYLPAWGR